MNSSSRGVLARVPDGLAAIAYRGAAILARRLPFAWSRAMGRAAGWACWWLQRARRTALARNLAGLSPGLDPCTDDRRSRRTFANFGESVVDTLLLSSFTTGEIVRRVRVTGEEHLQRALGEGGAVLLAAHAGNWEWAGAALAGRGHPLRALARPHGPRVERFFTALRARFGVRTSPRARDLRRAAEPTLLVLFCDRSGAAGRSADRRRRARRAVALAARFGWRLLPALALRERPGRYRVQLGPALHPGRGAAERARAAERALFALDRRLVRHPEQWFAFEPLERPT